MYSGWSTCQSLGAGVSEKLNNIVINCVKMAIVFNCYFMITIIISISNNDTITP